MNCLCNTRNITCMQKIKNKNVKFTTYAVYYILGEIKRELKENRLIKYSQKM